MTCRVGVITDTLRTRIAAAIESIRIQRDGDAARMADAVIAALKEAGLIVLIERHDYDQPRPTVFGAIRDFERRSK